jgi:hypothetical protein
MAFHSRLTVPFLLTLALMLVNCGDSGGPADGDGDDSTPPALAGVAALDETHVIVTFNEPVQRASAEHLPAYRIVEGTTPYAAGTESPGDTLLVLVAALTTVPETVALTTEPMEEVPYDFNVEGIKDVAGNTMVAAQTRGFTGTVAPDVTPPVLVYRSPGAGATGVVVSMPMGLQFSEPVYLYGLTWTSGSGPVLFDIETADNVRYTVRQQQPLAPGTQYTVEITGVQDYSSNFMTNVTWSFTTAE